MSDLLPCPFCGTEPEWINEALADSHYYIHCPECRIVMKADRRDKVIGMWNRRHKPKRIAVAGGYHSAVVISNNEHVIIYKDTEEALIDFAREMTKRQHTIIEKPILACYRPPRRKNTQVYSNWKHLAHHHTGFNGTSRPSAAYLTRRHHEQADRRTNKWKAFKRSLKKKYARQSFTTSSSE